MQNKTVVTNAFKGEDLNHYVPLFRKYDVPVLYNFKENDMRWVEYKPKARMHVLPRIFPDGIRIPDYFLGKNIVHLPTVKCHIYTTTTGAMKNAFGGLLHAPPLHAQLDSPHPGRSAGHPEGDPSRHLRHHGRHHRRQRPRPAHHDPGDQGLHAGQRRPGRHRRGISQDDGLRPHVAGIHPRGPRGRSGRRRPADIEIVGDDISRESWGFKVGDNLASMAGDLMWFGPLKAIQKLFFHTPLVNVFVAASEAYHDYYRWPVKDKKTFENWKRDTQLGPPVRQYENV